MNTIEEIAREAAGHIGICFGVWKDVERLVEIITAKFKPLAESNKFLESARKEWADKAIVAAAALAPLQAELEQAKVNETTHMAELASLLVEHANLQSRLQAAEEKLNERK